MSVVCIDIVQTRDRDRYLSALLAARDLRCHLFALYAFDLELRAIPERISDPLAGRIRLEWWEDSLVAGARGSVSGNPVADLLQSAIETGHLSYHKLIESIEARCFDIEGQKFLSKEELMNYLDQTFGTFIECACSLLSRGCETDYTVTARNAGRITGIIWILLNLATHLSKERFYLPEESFPHCSFPTDFSPGSRGAASLIAPVEDMRKEAEGYLEALNQDPLIRNRRLSPAFAHLAPARLYLRALRARPTPLAPARIPMPLHSQWRIWRFTRSLRL